MTASFAHFRILVIDDNDGDLHLFTEAVAALAAPIVVVTCKSAMKALDLLSCDQRFDLILSDLNMPHLSGTDLFKRMSEKAAFKHIPMAIMSSSLRDKLPKRIEDELTVPYFVKSQTWDDFLRLAQEILNVLHEEHAHQRGRRLAERMTPPSGYGKFQAPLQPPPT